MRRLGVVYVPNGIDMQRWTPAADGAAYEVTPILEPLAPFRDRMLTLHGVCDKVRGDGDNHMRGIGCLLTGVELFPGNLDVIVPS